MSDNEIDERISLLNRLYVLLDPLASVLGLATVEFRNNGSKSNGNQSPLVTIFVHDGI